jgi:hypothetical protein
MARPAGAGCTAQLPYERLMQPGKVDISLLHPACLAAGSTHGAPPPGETYVAPRPAQGNPGLITASRFERARGGAKGAR